MKALKIIGKFFAIIFSIIIFVLLISGAISIILANFISKENVSEIAQKINPKEIIINRVTLEEKIEKKFDSKKVSYNISQKILNIPETKELIGNISGEYIEYLFNKRTLPQISDEDIEKIINSKGLEEAIGMNFLSNNKDDIRNLLKEIKYEVNETLEKEGNKKDIFKDNNQAPIQYFLSTYFIFNLTLAFLGFVFLIILCTWSLYKFLFFVGVPTIISGIILVFIGLFSSALIKITYTEQLNYEFINNLIKKILGKFTVAGIILIGAGIILIIIYVFIKRNIYKNKLCKPKIEEHQLDEINP